MKYIKTFEQSKVNFLWCMKTKDFDRISFYFDVQNIKSPLETNPDFDGGGFWIVDCSDTTEDFYPEYPDDDSFVMIPKKDVIEVWCEDLEINKNIRKYNL